MCMQPQKGNTEMSHRMTKPTKWLCNQWRLRSAWASAQSDQSSLCAQWVAEDPSFLYADSENSDQIGQMSKLIWVFAGRTDHFVGFVMRRLKYASSSEASYSSRYCVSKQRRHWRDWADEQACLSLLCLPVLKYPFLMGLTYFMLTSCTLNLSYEPPHDKTKKWHVHPAKTQISLGLCPVWSES